MLEKEDAVQALAANAKHLMGVHSLTVRSLAKAVGVSHSTIQTIVSGSSEAGFVTVARLADFFQAPVESLVVPIAEPNAPER